MPTCGHCLQPATKRHGRDRRGRQRYVCGPCHRSFTADSASAFSGYRWPPEVILMAVRRYLGHPLSARSVVVFLAEQGADVSCRTVLRWVQTFGPLLAAEVRKHRRRPGTTWYVDEVFFFRRKGKEKRYLCRAIDEGGRVLDVLFRAHRDTEWATAFFRRTLEAVGTAPTILISDHHQPYIEAVRAVLPEATHVRTGLHRVSGETTKPIVRSHIATRDRLRSSRGLKSLPTGRRFFEGFEALQARRRGHVPLDQFVPGSSPTGSSPQEQARAVATAVHVPGARLRRVAWLACRRTRVSSSCRLPVQGHRHPRFALSNRQRRELLAHVSVGDPAGRERRGARPHSAAPGPGAIGGDDGSS
jgi:transposase-like protein